MGSDTITGFDNQSDPIISGFRLLNNLKSRCPVRQYQRGSWQGHACEACSVRLLAHP